MNAAQLIRVLLELDRQVVSPRPSAWGEAAELVALLADHAARTCADSELFGDWRDVDLSGVRGPAPQRLTQPETDAIRETHIHRGDY